MLNTISHCCAYNVIWQVTISHFVPRRTAPPAPSTSPSLTATQDELKMVESARDGKVRFF
jgi:hypothetical protein